MKKNKKEWTGEDIKNLKKYAKTEETQSRIAKLLDKSLKLIENKAIELKINLPNKKIREYSRWTEAEIIKLKKLAQTSKSKEDIVKGLNRNLKSIERKAENMNILLPSKYNRKNKKLK